MSRLYAVFYILCKKLDWRSHLAKSALKMIEMNKMCTFIKNYLHFIKKNCLGPTYKKPKPRKSAFIKNSSFEINRDPWAFGLDNRLN